MMKYIPICHANPQEIVDYKNFYIMSENKTNIKSIEMYSQDQVDEIEKELKAQIESYKADAERYRWLAEHVDFGDWFCGYGVIKDSYGGTEDFYMDDKKHMDETIDQAIKDNLTKGVTNE